MRFPARFALSFWLLPLVAGVPAPDGHARTEPYLWRNVVIGAGGFVSGLVYHPTTPGLLYARTDVGGAYRWQPAQNRWLPLNDDLGASDAELLGVVSLAVDAQDPARVYLACGSYLDPKEQTAALLASPDQGITWRRTELPFHLGGNSDGRNTGERLQVDPHDGALLFLGTNRDGLWRSADRGATWTRVAAFPASSLTFVLADGQRSPSDGPCAVWYAGVDDLVGPSLLVTVDAGKHWTPVPGAPAHLIPHHAALARDGTLFLTYADFRGPNNLTTGAVWKFQPSGRTWTNITPVVPNPAKDDAFGYAGLALDPQHPGTVLVSTLDRWIHHDEIFRSTDGGATWRPLLAGARWDHSFAPYTSELTPHWIGTVAIDPFKPASAWFVTGYGLWAADDVTAVDQGGVSTWRFADAGLEETVPLALASPAEGVHLLSAVGDIGGFRHERFDEAPATGAFDPAHQTNEGMAFAAHVPTRIVRTHSGPTHGAVSLDGGITWKDFASAPAAGSGWGKIALSCDGHRIVWVPREATAFVSSDDGATWRACGGAPTAPRDFHRLAPLADPENPDAFYLYDFTSGRVYASADGAAHFAVSAELPPGGGPIGAVPGRRGELWEPTPGGVFHSTDEGHHFKRVPGFDAADQIGFGAPAPGNDEPTIFAHGSRDNIHGLFRSTDGGRSWIMISDPRHNFGWIHAVAGDPRVFGRVYLATGGRGVIYGEPAP